MLTLINTNTMVPPIGPIGLDYIAGSVRKAGIDVDIIDLCLTDDPNTTLRNYFAAHNPQLVGVSFRNADDSFWPSAQWFVPNLADTIHKIRTMTDAPIVLGGVGFSIFAKQIVQYTGADFGIRGDGEQAIISLHNELQQSKRLEHINGLIWRPFDFTQDGELVEPQNGKIYANPLKLAEHLSLPTNRNAIDNFIYFQKGGQCGIETKRGCNRQCIYCADPITKGAKIRLRNPSEIADEVQSLIDQGIEVLHLCDSEFNIPQSHALAVCKEFNRRCHGDKIHWYTYMAVVPFDAELAAAMRKAGCVGIDFTGDSACPLMLKTYRQPHIKEDLATAVRLCRENNIKVMIDLLLGGPGETPETIAETINFIKQIEPDCAGTALGVRIYPGTQMAQIVTNEGPLEDNINIRRKYSGPMDFFKPTFYISRALGPNPAKLVKDLIAGDKRFFEPMLETTQDERQVSTDHNYNENTELVKAIKKGARGAYWDILHNLRVG